MDIIRVFWSNFWKFDFIIFILFFANLWLYFLVRRETERIYRHFNSSDRLSHLTKEALEKLKSTTIEKVTLSAEDLLDGREKMNKSYSLYSNFTTMFPLFGMLGTVFALIPMVNTIGTADTSNFFSALTSTAWGIIAAILYKGLDSTISYKIEDVEKHIVHLLFKE